MAHNAKTISDSAAALKLANVSELSEKCRSAAAEIKELEKQKAVLQNIVAEAKSSAILAQGRQICGLKLMVSKIEGAKPDEIRRMAEAIRDKLADSVCVIACVNGDSGNLCVACGKEAVAKGALAGKLVGRIAALASGKGGGRPDSAMAGISDVSKVEYALSQADEILTEFVEAKK